MKVTHKVLIHKHDPSIRDLMRAISVANPFGAMGQTMADMTRVTFDSDSGLIALEWEEEVG
jgi:hypothetical protein